MSKINIKIWSDFKCPYCYIGETNLKKAIEASGKSVEFEMMSYELNPNHVPNPDKSINEQLAEKYSTTVERIKAQNEQLIKLAKAAGLDYDLDNSADFNSFKAHKVAQLAKDKGVGNAFVEKAFSAHFEKSQNLGEDSVLVELGKAVGLTEADVISAINSEDYGARVREDEQEAYRRNINSVPHFIIGDKYVLSGAQPVEAFVEAIKKAAPADISDMLNLNLGGGKGCNGDVCSL